MHASDERGGSDNRGSIDDRDVEGLSLRERFAIVQRCVTRTCEALEASVTRVGELAAEHDKERRRARAILEDLNEWCALAEDYVRAMAREQAERDAHDARVSRDHFMKGTDA